MDYRAELETSLQQDRDRQQRIRADVARLKAELAERVEALRYVSDKVYNTRSALHRLDGQEKNCGHEFTVEPSGRGIGYDTVCKKCGWFENLDPSY